MYTGRHILIAPLDWGFGHSTRSAAIVRSLMFKNDITIGVSEKNRQFFKLNFPQLHQIELPSYNIRYSRVMPVWLKIIFQWPAIKRVIQSEKKQLEEIIASEKIDLIISDSRFGLYSNKCESIIISHQLKIRAPFFSSFANSQNKQLLQRFDEIWVPDLIEKSERLSGELSDSSGFQTPVKFIGPLSFLKPNFIQNGFYCDVLVVLSGPEPQRTILEKAIVSALSEIDFSCVLIRGTEKETQKSATKIKFVNFVSGDDLSEKMSGAKLIICRSGYSTLMDVFVLNKKNLIVIPTPGQTEQEYLANYWKEKFSVGTLSQGQVKTHLLAEIKTRLRLVP